MADVTRIVLSLVAVVGGLLATARLARRSRGVVRSGLRVVSRVPVSKGSSLLLVSVGSRMLLVGAAEGGLSLISELDPADLEPRSAETPAPLPGPEPPPAEISRLFADRSPAFAGSKAPIPSTDGPWTGLVRNLRRMTLRTAPEGPFRVRKR
jgi:flagellar biogenesis protein FliO